MGDLTRDQLVTEICDIVGKSVSGLGTSGTLLSTRVGTYYLNWSQRRIARYYSFHELDVITTTPVTAADTKTYTFSTLGLTRPKDIHSIILVDSANSRRLKRWSYKKFDKRIPDPTTYSTGRPSIYIRYGNQIELFRIPDAVYSMTIRYPQFPTPFTTGSQTSDFENKDELLITAGVMETYLALEEYTDAAVWYQRTLGMLKDAVMSDSNDVDWEPDGEPFNSDQNVDIGQPWISPAGSPEDPLYGYPD